jgi:predicted RNA binding protein YcfA (HicA-like mRNA interferase family)
VPFLAQLIICVARLREKKNTTVSNRLEKIDFATKKVCVCVCEYDSSVVSKKLKKNYFARNRNQGSHRKNQSVVEEKCARRRIVLFAGKS